MIPQPVNPLTTPANAIAVEVHAAIEWQVAQMSPEDQQAYWKWAKRDLKMRERNARVEARKAAKKTKRPKRRLTRGRRRRN